MIDAKELCIGNIVSAKDAKHDFSITYNYMEEVRYWKVVGLEDDWCITVVSADTKAGVSIANRSVRHQQGSSQFDPIPLTPQLLENAGFDPFVAFTWHRLILSDQSSTLTLYVDCSDHDAWLTTNDYSGDSECPKIKVQHLHQLQNLIFCLTGQVLDINLEGIELDLDGPGGVQKT
ncbi:hypothetical protein BWI93_19185 [Siphonobacter sp. BAB-5385]|uniref:hypothetical protein n=1 Tax=Siphonobacter sp. BAB-5385 TaxID=1864822 RepID=UPI000B9E7103|nr:hypothetical protein [Siphonobacter sp. BAB-5385]OZI06605.1 hypothetical protein BWI93_19185 [Siphonobacter sp. BAB-5385]